MNRLDSLISGTVAISLLLFSLSTQGADSPQATIQAAVQKNTHRPLEPDYEGPAHREDRLAKAEEVILSYFDTRVFARRALGRYWSQRTPAEQQEFVHLFTASLGVPVDLVYIGVRDQWPQRTIYSPQFATRLLYFYVCNDFSVITTSVRSLAARVLFSLCPICQN
jgi:MlaC protein